MADLNDIAVFVAVAQLGSFSRAARALAMPVSTVSRKVAALEAQLGVTLLARTTRKLTLTAQGRDYYDQCSEPLGHLQDAERVLTRAQRRPEGSLKVSVPVILGDEAFLAFVSAFAKRYDGIRVDLHITNQFLDLVTDNVDVAVRFGALESSSVVARRLGVQTRQVVAAPAYLAGRTLPREPRDLGAHRCVLLHAPPHEADWELVSGRRRARVAVHGALSSRDYRSVGYFVERGHGVGLLPASYGAAPLASGALVRLLPRWESPAVPVHVVYATRKFLPERVHVFVEELKAWRSPFWTHD